MAAEKLPSLPPPGGWPKRPARTVEPGGRVAPAEVPVGGRVDAKRLRLALCAWEIGRLSSGFGTKVGGLGGVVE